MQDSIKGDMFAQKKLQNGSELCNCSYGTSPNVTTFEPSEHVKEQYVMHRVSLFLHDNPEDLEKKQQTTFVVYWRHHQNDELNDISILSLVHSIA